MAHLPGLASLRIGTFLPWRWLRLPLRGEPAAFGEPDQSARRLGVAWAALALGIAAALLFGLTAHWEPGGRVNPGDSAKFQYLPVVNGTPHSTGYPTYLMIGKLLYHALPFLPASVRATAISVVCGACATALIFLWCVACTGAIAASLGAAALVATGANFWLVSTDAEVYALHLLYYSSVLLFLTRALNSSGKAALRTALILYALSFGNHLTTIALSPGVAWAVWTVEGRRLWRPRTLATAAGLLLLAVGQYAYIYYLSHWGSGRELEFVRRGVSLTRLIQYMTGQQFESRMFVYSLREIVSSRLPDARDVIVEQLSVAGVLCAALGLFRALVQPLRARFLPLVALGFAAQLFISLNYEIENGLYLTPVVVLLSVFVALGLSYPSRWWVAASVASVVVSSHAHETLTTSLAPPPTNPVAQIRWRSAQAVGCRALIAGPLHYSDKLIRKYLRYTGEYSLATPLSSIDEADEPGGLCVDAAAKRKLEPLGYHFRPQQDSLRDFFARNLGNTLLVALSADSELGADARQAFSSIGSRASQLRAGGAYVAIIHQGRPIAEQSSDGEPLTLSVGEGTAVGGFLPRKAIELRASGRRKGSMSAIRFANAERRTEHRVARFVVLDSKQSIVGDVTVRSSALDRFSLYFAVERAPAKRPGRRTRR